MIENPETLNTQAIELASQGEYPEAIACFMRAISMETGNYLLWYNLGVTYRDAGNLKAAKEALLAAYKLNDSDQELLETLSLVCFARDEINEAFEYCTEGLEINSDNAHVWNNIGVLYFTRGEYNQACEAFEQAVSLYPHYYDALFNLRDTYAELGNTKGSEECIRRLASLTNRVGTSYA